MIQLLQCAVNWALIAVLPVPVQRNIEVVSFIYKKNSNCEDIKSKSKVHEQSLISLLLLSGGVLTFEQDSYFLRKNLPSEASNVFVIKERNEVWCEPAMGMICLYFVS